ncbi:hypothetical protein MKX03_004592 [Papaver bracteatum]|nr:hypothetical protein MKX03_004592 [Papaver bracteatum]
MAKQESPTFTLLTPPPPITQTSKTTDIVDLEEGPEKTQCRICLETDRRGFIAPCMCKGTSKYVHRECLDQWRSVKEGFAFAHCTTCKSPYHLKVNTIETKKWRTMKFRFLVTRDVVCILIAVQLLMALLGYLVYLVDKSQKFWLRHALHFNHAVVVFYYICGALLFFALAGLSGCILTCLSRKFRDDLDQPCQQLCCCCSGADSRSSNHADSRSSVCPSIWIFPNYGGGSTSTSSGNDGSGLLILAVILLVICVVFGIFYSILVAILVWQKIWLRHYHVLAKRMLTKEYVVEDVDGLISADSNWCPPPLPAEHVEQLKARGLL